MYDDFPDFPAAAAPEETYNSEVLVHKTKLAETDYKGTLLQGLQEDKSLSFATKRALIPIVLGIFDKTVVLANLKDTEMAEIDLDIILNLAKAEFSAADTMQNSHINTVLEMVRAHYKAYISRAVGGDRERKLQNRMETWNESFARQEQVQRQAPEQKRGLLFWRR